MALATMDLLEHANLLMTSIGLPIAQVAGDANAIRIGTQEVTRWGMRPADMRAVAQLIARVLVSGETPEYVRGDTIRFRQSFQQLHFVRSD